ncbi:transposase family protein, partial [Corynebacterium belfantii]|nr:transposase family protein [Corynebacterium belfantii]
MAATKRISNNKKQGKHLGRKPGAFHLATVINVYSRKLIGYALADHMRVSLVIEALSHARKIRGSLDWAIFHSDHGSVYTSQAFRNYCSSLGVRQSMGAVGTSA